MPTSDTDTNSTVQRDAGLLRIEAGRIACKLMVAAMTTGHPTIVIGKLHWQELGEAWMLLFKEVLSQLNPSE